MQLPDLCPHISNRALQRKEGAEHSRHGRSEPSTSKSQAAVGELPLCTVRCHGAPICCAAARSFPPAPTHPPTEPPYLHVGRHGRKAVVAHIPVAPDSTHLLLHPARAGARPRKARRQHKEPLRGTQPRRAAAPAGPLPAGRMQPSAHSARDPAAVPPSQLGARDPPPRAPAPAPPLHSTAPLGALPSG